MYTNPLFGIINQDFVQEQLQRQQAQQYHNNEMRKSFDCARKLDDLMKSFDDVAPEYRQIALVECCGVLENYMRRHGMM